jgi:threonyl-tRNA synthetase
MGLGEPRFELSLRPAKRTGADEMWDRAEAILAETLDAKGITYKTNPGEGAFYGPKIDLFFTDAIGRPWQLGTIQLDFSLPERFALEFVKEDSSAARPVMIHRAMLGSLERFLGILIEHTGGALPLWLAPVQAVVIPIADRHLGYARLVEEQLRAAGLRAQVDARGERMNLKIREAQMQKVPYMLVVGDREQAEQAVAVRLRTGENLGARPLEATVAEMKERVAQRK